MPPVLSDIDLGFNRLKNALLESGSPIPPASQMRLGYFRLDSTGRPAYFDGTALKPFIDTSAFVDLQNAQTIGGPKTFNNLTTFNSNITLSNGVTISGINNTALFNVVRALTIDGISISGINQSANNLLLSGGASTGNVAGGSIIFRTSDPTVSGSTLQTYSQKAVITGQGALGLNTTSPGARLHVVGSVIVSPAPSGVFSNGNVQFQSTTPSTSTTSGALVVSGGVGVGLNLNVGQNVSCKGLSVAFATKNTDYTVLTSDFIIAIDASTGNRRITLPTAVGNLGKWFRFKKIDITANTVTIATNPSTQTIDGAITYILDAPYEAIDLISDGANWFIY